MTLVPPKKQNFGPKKPRSPAQTAAANANLVRYPKGVSGNPNGRPKGIITIAKEAAERCEPLLFLADVVLGKHRATMRDRITAANTVAAYAYGKPVDSVVQLSIDSRGIDTDAQLGGALANLARLLSGEAAQLPADGQIVDATLVATAPVNASTPPAAENPATNLATVDVDPNDKPAE